MKELCIVVKLLERDMCLGVRRVVWGMKGLFLKSCYIFLSYLLFFFVIRLFSVWVEILGDFIHSVFFEVVWQVLRGVVRLGDLDVG